MTLIEPVNMSRYNKMNVDDIFVILYEEDHFTLDNSASEEEEEKKGTVSRTLKTIIKTADK